MKLSIPRKQQATRRSVDIPPIPLDRQEEKTLVRSQYITLKLRSNPTEDTSQTYNLILPYYNSASLEEWLIFRTDLNKAIIGQNITQGPARYTTARQVLQGDALALFDAAAAAGGNKTNANFKLCLNDVTDHVFPHQALQRQKRGMQCSMQKPSKITVQEFATRINKINVYLDRFLPNNANQKLPEDKILDLLADLINIPIQATELVSILEI